MTDNQNENIELLVRIAWYYYKSGMTQEEIANRLGLNRARVIKALEAARKQGIISFSIKGPYTNCLQLENDIKERWKLRDTLIIPEIEQIAINRNLGAAVAQYVTMRCNLKDALIGVGWGNTVSYVLDNLTNDIISKVSLITLCGGINVYLQHTYGQDRSPMFRLMKRFHIIPAPQIASSNKASLVIMQEPQVARVIQMAGLANMAIVGIGGMSANETMINVDEISFQEYEVLGKLGAVGSILGQFFDRQGRKLEIEYHQRVIAVDLETLKNMQHVIGTAGGDHKVDAIRGALRGGFIHSLITDERTAMMLLEKGE